MAIKVQFPSGKTTVTVEGLFQWDYGQELEIECNEIGTEILEVHFACQNMQEAKVRACSFIDGVGVVTIPDECLEQTGTLTAWVYRIGGSHGHTIRTINLPLMARIRPGKKRDVPPEHVDQYGQLIEEVNKAINRLEYGEITVAEADYTPMANYAVSAGSARSATYASSAGSADSASTAGSIKPQSPVVTMQLRTDATNVAPDNFEGNTIYGVLLLAPNNVSISGVAILFQYSSETFYTCNFALGSYSVQFSPGSYLYFIDRAGEFIKPDGTLYFYKLGGISA